MCPYGATMIVCIPTEGMPCIFVEIALFYRSVLISAIVASVSFPGYLMSVTPDARAFLLSAIVLCAPLSLCWFVGRAKLDLVRMGGGTDILRQATRDTGDNSHQGRECEKIASDALSMGAMFASMGSKEKALDVYDEALSRLRSEDSVREDRDRTGHFTKREIDSFSPEALEGVIKLLVQKGKTLSNINFLDLDYHRRATVTFMEAIDIFGRAPAARKIKDRSIIYPCYSAVYVMNKTRILEDVYMGDRDELVLERKLAERFVRASNLESLSYARALAMQSEVMGRLGKYKLALEAIDVIDMIYAPEEHSEFLVQAYSSDKLAQAISLAAVWKLSDGDEDGAKETCSYVVDQLLPKMFDGGANSYSHVFMSLFATYNGLNWPDGKALSLLELFEQYVIGTFEKTKAKDGRSPCQHLFKPAPMWLRLCAEKECLPYNGMDEDICWVLNDFEPENKSWDALDMIYTNTCWSPNTSVAEICLRLAWRLDAGSEERKKQLVERGLLLVKKCAQNIKCGNKISLVHDHNAAVFKKLRVIAEDIGVDVADDYHGNEVTGRLHTSTVQLSKYLIPEAD